MANEERAVRPVNPDCVRVVLFDGERYVTQDIERRMVHDSPALGDLVRRMLTMLNGEQPACGTSGGGA